MPRIVIIGAGSGFGSRLSIDILARPSLQDSTIALCDLDEERLAGVTDYVRRAIEGHGLPATLLSSAEREELLPGADFVITSVSVGGGAYWGEPYASEVNIPRRYGVDQRVADTIGPGGVFRFLRTAPVQLAFCRDVERLCPEALLINYTNPMAMLTWLHSTASRVRNVGLCHSVQGTTVQLAGWIGVPYEEVSFLVAGINHQSWVLRFERDGEDLCPRIREAAARGDIPEHEAVRRAIMEHFGYFVTESSGHNSEYLPYFRRTPALRERFGLKEHQVRMEAPRSRRWAGDTEATHQADVPQLAASREYAAGIIEAATTGEPFPLNGNVMNDGLIANLPAGCCVEVPCTADADGIHPVPVGALPPQCAALNRSNVAVQELAVRAVLERDREAAFHAVALDPLTAAVLPLHEIRAMFGELWAAEGELLSYFD
jgi:alpha-galactosidase